ncbi:MAG: 2-oxo acid dehydrogenase subunit E2 [Planctomycetes bacterium]|nr:2-oxo acid dehydrogenase subunit E2 [Planctomycetota bacterium]MBL7144989.1 2-oxo acid dehydrogenase subunit E2 [Phycisphaerae bacterium]
MDNPTKKHIRLTRIQKLIGDRMLTSKLNKPCFYICSKADITELMAIRPKLRKSLGVKITTNAFYIHALGLAVQKYPLAAGKVEGDKIKIAERINVGFAVNAPQGLVVPVIKDAGEKTLPDIAREEALLTYKARDNKLTLEEIEGETVALSNLGAYGIDCFLGIVPPPASTILAVGNAIATPIYQSESNTITVRKIVSLSMAADHRVMNEVYAAEFLNFITQELQNPHRLI